MFFLGQMRVVARGLPIVIAACSLYGAADDEPSPTPPTEDAGSSESSVADALGDELLVEAGARCDLSKPFGTPKQVPGINTTEPELNIWLSDDEKTAYVTVIRAAVALRWDIYTTSRTNRDDAFGPLARMTDLDLDTANTEDLTLTPDGLFAAFSSSRPPSDASTSDLFIATRMVATAPFTNVTPIANVNDPDDDENPFLTTDGLELFFNSLRDGGTWELFHAVRGTGGSFGAPVNAGVGPGAANATLTRDGLTLYFTRIDASGSSDIWIAKRASSTAPFLDAKPVDELSSPERDVPGWVSPDGCRLYFMSARAEGPGGYDQWFADKPP